MIFLGSCPDQVGLVAKISSFFADHNENIVHLEEHTERGRFFLRIEGEGRVSRDILEKDFVRVADQIQMNHRFFDPDQKTKLALFCSGTLHCPLEIINRQVSGALPVEILCIVSNAEAMQPFAERFEIPFHYLPTKPDPLWHEQEQLKILQQYQLDLVVLARYMKIISGNFLRQCGLPVINIHHSFLPSFVGGRPYEMAYDRGVKMVGATAHFVTEELDEGPIISQGILPVDHTLTVAQMKQSGANIEKYVFAEAISKYAEHKIIEWQGRTIVFR